ncbi:MAG: sugar phosphate isomerase/epimerase [Bacteroidetes bacterium]|nr:sugar phosphate isomerase/epimerase [Bacteroidota bacterium]
MNLLLWGTEINETLFPVLEEIRSIGFEGVEIPIFRTDPSYWRPWRKKLEELGLRPVAVTLNGPEFNQISSDAGLRAKTLERNKMAIDCAAVLGSKLLTGPFHSALGVFTGKPAREEELGWAADNLRELAEYAQNQGIVLGLEYLNRFESYLVTCSEELIALIKRVDHPACKVMFDTFHANIEEKSLTEAIHHLAPWLVHVQLSENDRSTLGQGHINFREILSTLHQINYEGMLSIEAFSPKLSAANIWRKMFVSESDLMRDSFKHLQSLL